MMKRVLCILVCLCLALSLPLTAMAQQRSGQIHIHNVEDLLDLAENCVLDSYSRGKTVYLHGDLDLTNVDFDGIPSFGGTFEGNGYTVSGWSFTDDRSVAGFFRYVQQGGVIRNLKVSGQVTPAGTAATVGGIAGSNRGLIVDCAFTGSVTGKSGVGGIAGVNETDGSILRCFSHGVVVGENMTGGIVGYNMGLVENCENQAGVNIYAHDAPLDISSIDLNALVDPSTLSAGITVMDTGGIAGYSVGALYECVNMATVGYPHIGYNVGGIVGRSSGRISACVNQASVQGRKDVGGIVGQMEPNVTLNLSEDHLQKLETQAGELEELIRALQESFDRAGVVSTHLNNTLTHFDGVSASLETLTGHVGNYGNALTDEFNRASLLVQDAMEQLLPVLEQMTVVTDSMEAVTKTLADAMAVLADAASYLESGLLQMRGAVDNLKNATAQISQAMDRLVEGVELLTSGLQEQDPEQTKLALEQIQTSLQQFSQSSSQAAEAAEQLSEALQQQGAWNDDAATAFADALQALAGMNNAMQLMTEGVSMVIDNLQYDAGAFWDGVERIGQGMECLTNSMSSLQAAANNLSSMLSMLAVATELGEQALDLLSDAMEKLGQSLDQMTKLGSLLYAAVERISRYEPIQLPKMDSGAQEASDALFDHINSISDELRSILSVSDTLSTEAKQLFNEIYNKFNEMLATAMELTDQVLDTATEGIIKDTSDADIEAVQAGKVSLCRNEGSVTADINAGGIAGAMAIEYQLDPEDDFTTQLSEYRLRTYQAKAVVTDCVNLAQVQGKRNYIGGICGRMDMGIIVDCGVFASVSSVDGDYVGGIAGSAAGPIRRCGVKTDLSGGKYVGGVAGIAVAVENCRTMVTLAGQEFVGTILGYAQMEDLEQIINNLYYALPDMPGAIDGISYDGRAQASQWEDFLNSPEGQQYFDHAELTFLFADGSVETVVLPLGAALEPELVPQLQNTDQHIHFWTDLETQLGQPQFFDRVFTETVKSVTTVLESQQTRPNGKPIVLLQGSFLGAEQLQLQPLTDVPQALEGWSFAVPEGGKVAQIRFAIPEGAENVQILVRGADGTLQPVNHTTVGSYLVFTPGEDVTAFYVEVFAEETPWTLWIIIAAAALVALIVVILLLRKKKRKAR